MTAADLIKRKWKAGLTDLQLLLLLELARAEMLRLTDLADTLGRPVPTVSMAATAMMERGHVCKDAGGKAHGAVFLYLTPEGKGMVGRLLGK